MQKKIFNIPIEAPEEVAIQFIELICKALGFTSVRVDEKGEPYDLDGEELHQAKLDFVGGIAGKYLRSIAESQLEAMEYQKFREGLQAKQSVVADMFIVKSVEVKDV